MSEATKRRKSRYVPRDDDGKNIRGFCPTKAYRDILRPETRKRLEALERREKTSKEAL